MLHKIYHPTIPQYIDDIIEIPLFQRLKDVGMNCGMEYTKFELFKYSKGVSRYDHSIGVALITYHFSQDKHATVAALLHDISTPVFAHVIDFLNGDYLKQESTELKTKEMIFNDQALRKVLERHEIDIEKVYDYHRYPIADNDSPKLSADRLEYTLANAYHYRFLTLEEIKSIYDDLMVNQERDELIFKSKDQAILFTETMFRCSDVYTCDEDRYCMEYLARLIKEAMEKEVLSEKDLYSTETEVIHKLCLNHELKKKWDEYCMFNKVDSSIHEKEGYYKIKAKKRYIDPIVDGLRVVKQEEHLKKRLNSFLEDSFDRYVKAYR